jgi:hypothetical protein
MDFRENDAVVVRSSGKRGTIRRVQHEPPPPYQVDLLEGGCEWMHAADLMLWCGCADIGVNGCTCGAFQREQEAACINAT